MFRLFLGTVLAAMIGFVAACSAEKQANSKQHVPATPIGTGFDFYVLSLSWSPGYCLLEGNDANPRQCGDGKDYTFIVHGLWPQFERGYPSDCASEYGERLESHTANSMTDIMPSLGLIKYQWRKHGTCSGLSPGDYFTVTRAAFEKIKLPSGLSNLAETKTMTPQAVEKLFQSANPKIPGDAISATCKQNYLQDVRICMTKDLSAFRTCPEVDRDYCRSSSMRVAPNR